MPYRSDPERAACHYCSEPAAKEPCKRCGVPLCPLHVYSDDGLCHRCSALADQAQRRSHRSLWRGAALAVALLAVVAAEAVAFTLLAPRVTAVIRAELQDLVREHNRR